MVGSGRFFYNSGNIAERIFTEFQRKHLKYAGRCGQHMETGIFDSVIFIFLKNVIKNRKICAKNQ